MKKSFSLLEIIFVIAIIALILSFALKNGFSFLSHASSAKIKTDIALIRNAIATSANKRVYHGKLEYPQRLDDAPINVENQLLFKGLNPNALLEYPLLSTSKELKKKASWVKVSNTVYGVFINSETFVEFTYDNSTGNFTCNYEQTACKDLD
ncbi:MAG: type II secretion system protein [Candidatus Marinarcus sp.]|uniref:type II secretion system protein n=1 Tax=Candidatus Marinarcus sp. TaxID=3100987 RepID=UPI003AFFEDCD